MAQILAAFAAAFTASIGVNTHIDLISSAYQNFAAMENAIAYLGVANVRDTYDNFNDAQEYAQMAADLGVKFDFFLALGLAGVPWQIAQIEANQGIVKYAEGYNESDNWWQTYGGQTGIGATQAAQETLYADIHADPQLAGVSVIQASFGQLSTFSIYGDMAAYADFGNTHTYFGTGNNPDSGGWANYLLSLAQSVTPGKPVLTTEAGWFTMPGNASGVDQNVQAKYMLDLLMEQFQAGVSLTYLYGLVDNFADPGNLNSEDHFGLFNAGWTAKPAAVALHNLMAIVADPGTAGFTPGTLDFSLAGMSASCRNLLTEKSDGTFVLTLWNDVRLSGPISQTEIPVDPIPVTLTLEHPFPSITIYDPLAGTNAIQSFVNADTIQIAVPDHPVIVEISPAAHPLPSRPVIAAPACLITTPGTAVHVPGLAAGTGFTGTLTVKLSSPGGLLASQNLGGHVLASGTHSLTLTGAQADINTQLATLTYTGGPATGTDSVALSVRDSAGHSGKATILVRIVPPATAVASGGPLLSAPASFTVAVSSTAAFPDLSLSDPYAAVAAGTMSLAATSTQGVLHAKPGNATITGGDTAALGLAGTYAQITASLATLTYTAGGAIGTASVTLSATDQGARTSSQTIAINAIAKPLLAGPASLQAQASRAAPVPGVALSDDYAVAHVNQATAIVTAGHGTLALLDGSGRPLPGSGTARITVSGTVALVDAALATLTYTAALAGQADSIRVSGSDLYGGSAVLPIAVTAGAVRLR